MPLNPGLLRELERGNSQSEVSSSYDALGGAAMAAMEAYAKNSSSRFESIANTETRLVFETAFNETVELFDRVEIQVPTPEEYAKAGVDFAHLAREYERMQAEGLEPAVVPAGTLPAAVFKEVYTSLNIHEDIQYRWSTLMEVPEGVPHIDDYGDDGEAWTVRLIPAGSTPPFRDLKGRDDGNLSHLTIGEYLTLQARRRATNAPVLNNQYTWVNGESFTSKEGNICAPVIIVFGDGGLSIYPNNVQGRLIDARPAVG